MSIWTVLKNVFNKKLADRCKFFSSSKDKCTDEKGYLHAINVSNVFKMNSVGD